MFHRLWCNNILVLFSFAVVITTTTIILNPSSSLVYASAADTTTIFEEAEEKNEKKSGLFGGIGRFFRQLHDEWTNEERSRSDLKIGIAGFYDRSSKLWEEVWGEHMHHGYYVPPNRTDHQQAQIDLIDEVLKWAGVSEDSNPPQNVVDVGCGIGGSSRHIVRKFDGCQARGVTLSPYQANRGNELALEQGLEGRASFQVADALDMPFDDNSFDLVWSLESGEHMPEKPKFIHELFRVATPGGRIIIVTWCHRDLNPDETSLRPKEEKLLASINRAYYLPKWCSVADYVRMLEEEGGVDIKFDDWSHIIAPFWKAVIQSSLNVRSLWGLMKSGFSTQRGAFAMLLMLRGFQKGLIKFGLLTCTTPLSSSDADGVDDDSDGGDGSVDEVTISATGSVE